MISQLNIETNGYAISTCCDILNENLEGYAVSNHKVKQMVIAHFGEDICFTYPKEKRKSQLFFSTKIASADLVETLRLNDPVKICAEKLKKECEEFDFLLENSYCDANDVEYSLNLYKQNRPKSWEHFFNTLFDYRKKSVHIQRKCDNVFQIIFNIVHNGQKKTPVHVSLSETVHDIYRSKELIQILNRMGLCMSYNEVERLDNNLALRTIKNSWCTSCSSAPIYSAWSSYSMCHG